MGSDARQHSQRKPQRLRRIVEFHSPDPFLYRLIAVAPLMYGAWCVYDGRNLPASFWWLVVGTVMFHLLARTTPYLKLTPSGLHFPQQPDTAELKWTELREARNTGESMNLLLGTGEQVRIEYEKLRRRDASRLRQMIKTQCQALATEARSALERGEVFGPASTARA